MGRLFNIEILHSQPIYFRYLNNIEIIDFIKQQTTFNDQLIYFLCKVNKIRFDLESIVIKNNNSIETDLIIANKGKVKVVSRIFKENPSYALKLNKEKSTAREVIVEGAETPIHIVPEALEISLPDYFLNNPEVIYIGESLRVIERLQKHEKIVKASSQLEDYEELRIYINSFKYSYIGSIQKDLMFGIGNLGLNHKNLNKKEQKEISRLSERILIHFLQPKYNEEHKALKMNKDRLVKSLLLKFGIDCLYLSYDIEQGFYHFNTPSQLLNTKSFYFDFRKPELGFTKGYPPFEMYNN